MITKATIGEALHQYDNAHSILTLKDPILWCFDYFCSNTRFYYKLREFYENLSAYNKKLSKEEINVLRKILDKNRDSVDSFNSDINTLYKTIEKLVENHDENKVLKQFMNW